MVIIKKLGLPGFVLLFLSCEEPPDIARNTNPFPHKGMDKRGPMELLALDPWFWAPDLYRLEEDTEVQNQAGAIFQGVRMNFFFHPRTSSQFGTFNYTLRNGIVLTGEWEYDMVESILSMDFDEPWESPIVSNGNMVFFKIHQIDELVLEMRFNEVDELKKAILLFVHNG